MKKILFSFKKDTQFSIFYIMLCINLFSITLLSCFNYYVFHNMNTKAYLESFISYNQRVTNLAFRNIDEQIIEAIYNIPRLYFSPITPNAPILLPQKERIDHDPAKITSLLGSLDEIQKSSPHIRSLDIYYEATKTIVTGFSHIHFIANDQEINQYLPWYPAFEEAQAPQQLLKLSHNIYPTNEAVLTYVKKISQPLVKGSDIIVAIHISPSELAKYIDESEGILMIIAPDDQIKYCSSPYSAEEAAAILRYKAKHNSDITRDSFPFSLTVENEKVTVFHTDSAFTDLEYLYCIKDSTFYADYNIRAKIFIWNFLISILFNLAVLILISILNYSAYKKRILIFSKKAGFSIKDGNKSFDHSLSMMSEEITSLNASVKSSKPLLFQNSVRSLLLNRKAETAYTQLCAGSAYRYVRTFIIHLPIGSFENLALDQLQQNIVSRGMTFDVFFTTLEKGEVIAVILLDQEHMLEVFKAFTEWLDTQLTDYTLVSGDLLELTKENIKLSFKSASEAARYQFIFTDTKLLCYEDIKIPTRKSHGSHLKLFDAIKKDIQSENFLDYKYHIDALITSFKTGNYTIDYCISTLRDLVTLLYQIMIHRDFDMWVIYGYDIREYYKQITDIDMFHDWVNNLCEVLLQNIRQKKKSVDVNIKDTLTKLIEEHLEHDISLDFLSDQLSLRPDVVSRMFKQVMGEGYTEYIKKKKLNRALELIGEDYSMKEIAQKLGYNSTQYFIKI
ncbi:MAG: AraC family transcriptional regulator, partial [Hungatella sp.]